MTTTVQQTTTGLALENPISGFDQYVRVRVGKFEFAMNSDCLSGVFQLSRQHQLTDHGTILTANGEYPAVSLADVFAKYLNIPPVANFSGSALIAVEHGSKVSMMRADSVSRPSPIKPEHVHPMPRIANIHDRSQLVRSIVNIAPAESVPRQCVRWVFDPMVALGNVANPKLNGHNPLPKEAASAVAATSHSVQAASEGKRGVGQLLAFVPNDSSKQNSEFVFCLPLNAIAEVITVRQQLDTTFTTPNFDGFILWRKVPVPVVRLGGIFGGEASAVSDDSSRRLVIARGTGNRFIGFYAKPQMQTMKIPAATPESLPSLEGRPHRGCFKAEFAQMVVPDINRILDNDF